MGSPEFIGIGFLPFVSIILTERFGSPFLISAVVGCIVGAAAYIENSSIKTTPAITFLWYVQLNT
jgi:xanthine/uracil permease